VRPVPLVVRDVVRRTVELFVEYAPIAVDVPDELPRMLGDPERVEQILANLLANAFSYAAEPHLTVRHVGEHLELEVADRGRGMSEAELERAFAKFERISRGRGPSGTGLGLFISRAMAEAQDGSLTGTSELGVGSRFTLRLPVVPEDVSPDTEATAHGGDTTG
jgi:signal transduction histidine kinase